MINHYSRRRAVQVGCIFLGSMRPLICSAQNHGELKIPAVKLENVKVGGLLFEKSSWSWIGLKLSEGVLDFLGGRIISSVADALIGGGEGDLGEVLSKQLGEFSRILGNKFQKDALRRCQNQLTGIMSLMREFGNAPGGKDRLEHATSLSNLLIAELKDHEFAGYRTFMSAASIHMLILQERSKFWKGEDVNYRQFVEESIKHHKDVTKKIVYETDPCLGFTDCLISNGSEDDARKAVEIRQHIDKKTHDTLWYNSRIGSFTNDSKEVPFYVNLNTSFYGDSLRGFIAIWDGKAVIYDKQYYVSRFGRHSTLVAEDATCIDFGELRSRIKSNSVDKSELIVKCWTKTISKRG